MFLHEKNLKNIDVFVFRLDIVYLFLVVRRGNMKSFKVYWVNRQI